MLVRADDFEEQKASVGADSPAIKQNVAEKQGKMFTRRHQHDISHILKIMQRSNNFYHRLRLLTFGQVHVHVARADTTISILDAKSAIIERGVDAGKALGRASSFLQAGTLSGQLHPRKIRRSELK